MTQPVIKGEGFLNGGFAKIYVDGKDTPLSLIGSAAKLCETLEWIRKIADVTFEQDPKLRSRGARTLKRIADKAEQALAEALGEQS